MPPATMQAHGRPAGVPDRFFSARVMEKGEDAALGGVSACSFLLQDDVYVQALGQFLVPVADGHFRDARDLGDLALGAPFAG